MTLTAGALDAAAVPRGAVVGAAGPTTTSLETVKAVTTSTLSPGLIRVPTPVTWSTWTGIPTKPAGTMMLEMLPPPLRITLVISCWAVTGWRAVCPITSETSP